MRRVVKGSENTKKWAVTVSWVETGDVVVEAESAEVALDYVREHIDELERPKSGLFLPGSLEVYDEDPDWIYSL